MFWALQAQAKVAIYVYAVTDASGGVSIEAHDMAIEQRMSASDEGWACIDALGMSLVPQIAAAIAALQKSSGVVPDSDSCTAAEGVNGLTYRFRRGSGARLLIVIGAQTLVTPLFNRATEHEQQQYQRNSDAQN